MTHDAWTPRGPGVPRITNRERRRREVWRLSTALYQGGLVLLLLAVAGSSMELIAVASLAAALGYALRDCFAPEPDSVGPMTVYALVFGVWCSLAHLIALYTVGTAYEELFYSWAIPEYLAEAQTLASLNVVVPLVAYDWAMRRVRRGPGHRGILPQVGANVPTRLALVAYLWLLAVNVLTELTGISLRHLGSLNTLFTSAPNIVIFALAWHWLGPAPTLPRWTRPLLVVLVVAAVLNALMFSFMRGEVAYPILMLFLAALMRKNFSRTTVVAACLALLAIAASYRVLGTIRQSPVYGAARLATMAEQYAADPEGLGGSVMTLIARQCQFVSLSQVVRITHEDGFYNGETLAYLAYAFVPRLIWRDKPQIAPGQWFAERIGRGTRLDEGRFSNSVNMTLAGEFYLNFGWSGALAGLVLLGFTFAIIWPTTVLVAHPGNVVRQAFTAILLLQSFGSGFASAIPQLFFSYLSMLAVGWLLGLWFGPGVEPSLRARGRVPYVRQPPPRRLSV